MLGGWLGRAAARVTVRPGLSSTSLPPAQSVCLLPSPHARLPPPTQFIALLSYTVLGFLNYRRACALPPAEADRALLLLLLCCSLSFGEMMARLLVLRLGWLKLPTLPRAVICQAAFRVALEFGPAACLLALAATALVHLSFFVPAVRSIAKALEIHPFRVRGAVHWYSLRGGKTA